MSTSTFTFVVEAVSGPTTYYSRASGGAAMTAVAFPAADLSDRCVRVPTDRQVPEQQVRSGELLLSSVEQMGRAEHILSTEIRHQEVALQNTARLGRKCSSPPDPSNPGCEIVFGGPWTFTRQKGKPKTENVRFNIEHKGSYTLRVVNGDQDGSHRVCSGIVTVNGKQVVRQCDFKKKVALIEREVMLERSNLLSVMLQSSPGSHITISVVGYDVDAPTITITDPESGAVNETGFVDVRGTTDDTGAAITVNGVSAVILDEGRFCASHIPLIPDAPSSGSGTCAVTATAIDACGNIGSASVLVTLTPFRIKITSPEDGTSLLERAVTISGNVNRLTAAVTVNGEAARVNSQEFLVENIGISPGSNSITAEASFRGESVADTIHVTGIPLAVHISSPADGATVASSLITVCGTISHPDSALTVNGQPITTDGDQFSALIPLTPGSNRITAQVFLFGETATDSISVQLGAPDVMPLDAAMNSINEDEEGVKIVGEVTVTVVNQGPSDVETPFQVTIFEDRNHTGTYEQEADSLLGTTSNSSGLPAGSAADEVISVVGEVLFRDSPLTVLVDSDDELEEIDENNNTWIIQNEEYDLTSSCLWIDEKDCPDEVKIMLRVGNAGREEVAAGVPVSFYDGEEGSGGTLIGTVQTSDSLAASYYQDVVLQWEHPTAGRHTIVAAVDDDGQGGGLVEEINEENNYSRAEMVFCARPPVTDSSSVSGQLINAASGEPITLGVVSLHESSFGTAGTLIGQTTSDEYGWFQFLEIAAGSYVLRATADGFISDQREIILAEDESLTHQDVVLSPVLESEQIRIVLTWGKTPADLEAHLTTPNPEGCRYHCYYWERTIPGASLDTDDRDSYGPETITITERTPGTYRYYVHDWTNRSRTGSRALAQSGAEVRIYRADHAQPEVFTVPLQEGTVWHVCDIDGDSGLITSVNTMTYQQEAAKIDFPRIISSPPTRVSFGGTYRYQVASEDPDPERELSYTLLEGPAGMTLEPHSGLLQWTPAANQSGTERVRLQVEQDVCERAVQEFTISVDSVPSVSFEVEPCSGYNPGGTITLRWSTIRAESCTINNGIGSVDMSGTLSIPSSAEPVSYTITATNQAGSVEERVPELPELEVLEAEPRNVLPGGGSQLRWNTACGVSCTITPLDPRTREPVGEALGPLEPDGTVSVYPQRTTIYCLKAVNGSGSASCVGNDCGCVTVSVTPHVTFSSDVGCEWNAGDPVTLTWDVAAATYCEIDQGIGPVSFSGSLVVTPPEPTTYTLRAVSPGGTDEHSIRVAPPRPETTFSAGRLSCAPGETVELRWWTKCADSCSIDQGIGSVALSGTMSVTPAVLPVTYTLTAANEQSESTARVTINRIASPVPVISFSASPATLKAVGESCTLSWSTQNAVSCRINPGIGVVDLNGTLPVQPAQTTTYTLAAANGHGSSTYSSVTVRFPKPEVSISADPAWIGPGEASVLRWILSNVQSASIEPDIGIIEPNGIRSVSPQWTTKYTIKATGPGGSATDSVTVTTLNVRINSPAEGAIVHEQPISVSGTAADPHAAIVVNGISAVPDSKGAFTVNGVALTEGLNTISVTAERNGKLVTVQRMVTFVPSPLVIFAIEPNYIASGESAELSWQVRYADSVSIEPNIGAVAAEGSVRVSPWSHTTYRLSAQGPGGTTQAEASIAVLDLSISAPRNGSLTNEQTIAVCGITTDPLAQVSVNGNVVSVDETGAFRFEPLTLQEGSNIITAVAARNGHQVTETIRVTYEPLPPLAIRITDPVDGAIITVSPITVSGTITHPQARVTVNGVSAAVNSSFKTFSAQGVILAEGENTITAVVECGSESAQHSIQVSRYSGALIVPDTIATIQAAIDAASPGNVILVHSGTYPERINFKGKAISVISTDGADETIIDGGGSGSVVYFPPGEWGSSMLKGFTIQHGSTGIHCDSSSPVIENCMITNNSSTSDGGGIYCASYMGSGQPQFRSCTVSGNQANRGAGAYVCCSARPTFESCVITQNQANSQGGAVYAVYYSTVSLAACAIQHNTAYEGGGIYSSGASVSMANCMLVNNHADFIGGCVNCDHGEATVMNCTVADNSTDYWLDGLYFNTCSGTITNTIVWDNEPIYNDGNMMVVTYSDVQGGFSGTGIIDADPLFVDPANGNYHLQAGSPCINVGTSTGALTSDIDGEVRPMGGGYDIGADEVTGSPPLAVRITSPLDGAVVHGSPVTVRGEVNNVDAQVTVNGINAQVAGNLFTVQDLVLIEGENTITAEAELNGESNSHSIHVSYEPLPALAVRITSPVDGATVQIETITVTGTVNDNDAVVTVNGAAATVSNGVFSAEGISLIEGENSITATASRAGETATDSISVTYSIAATIRIESPTDGARTYDEAIEVSGTVSPEEAIVTVNGIDATVAAGRFTAPQVPLTEGANILTAQAQYEERTATDSVSVMYVNPFELAITYPTRGANLLFDETMVAGTVSSALPGYLVEVNGQQAEINGSRFVASGISLTQGVNVITATAQDTDGHSRSAEIMVNVVSEPCRNKIELRTDVQSGVAPLEITFCLQYSYPDVPAKIVSAAMDWDGDGTNDYVPTSTTFTHTYTAEGIYYPRATLTDELGNVYQAVTFISVIPMPPLQELWDAWKTKMVAGDIDGALAHIEFASRDKYRVIFDVLQGQLAGIISSMQPLEYISVRDRLAEFRLVKMEERDGQMVEVEYAIYFTRDGYGNWMIESF